METIRGEDVFCSESVEKGIFFKSKHAFALCDIAPVTYGHSLVIPKRHVLDVTELTEEEFLDMYHVIRKVKAVVLRLYGDSSNSYDLTAQIGEYSGMSVRHLHFHIIPRRKGDEYQTGKSVFDAIEHVKRLDSGEYEKRVSILRKELDWRE
jgi:diadenosine tetraphosphate (Ap4A) HIT family hydrolase